MLMGRYRSAVQDRLILPAQVLLTLETQQLFRLLERPMPQPAAVRLIIDTGSRRSSLVPSVLDRLKPPPFKIARVETSLAAVETELFSVRLAFPPISLAPLADLAIPP